MLPTIMAVGHYWWTLAAGNFLLVKRVILVVLVQYDIAYKHRNDTLQDTLSEGSSYTY